jgi:hypothetical protein
MSLLRFRSCLGVSLLRRPLYGLSLVLNVNLIGVPVSLKVLRNRLTR